MILKTNTKERKTPNPFGQGHINPTNQQTMKWLKGVHPSLSKHIWERNGLVQAIAMERFGGIDILELPVCEKCERPGAWHDNDSCWCNPCGHQTKKENTKSLYRYIAEDSMPGGMNQQDMEILDQMTSVFSGALRKMFEDIERLEYSQYKQEEDETAMVVEETIIDDVEESEDNHDEAIEADSNDTTVSER